MLQVAIAHDLRNVLAIIIGNCENAGVQPRPRHILRIRAAAVRGAALLEGDDYDEKVNFREPINLNAIVKEVGEMLGSALVLSDKVRLSLDLTEQNTVVAGSSLGMFRSVFNLCLNARDAMIEKGGELKISTRSEAGSVMIAISDTGKGMTEKRMQTLWMPKVSADKKRGHGLQNVRVSVSRMNGKIAVQSEAGVGTTFTISLPELTI